MDVLASSIGREQPHLQPKLDDRSNLKTLSVGAYKSLSSNAIIVERVLTPRNEDKIDVDISGLDKNLSFTAQKVLAKLNELLKEKLPEGIESLKAEEYTPEKTADRIVAGVTALFSAFSKQNGDLSQDEVLSRFMSLVTKGVEQGYNDAYSTLDGLGAFEFEGVKSGVEQTKRLIDQKLKAFEAEKRKELGLDDPTLKNELELMTKGEITQKAGVQISGVNALAQSSSS